MGQGRQQRGIRREWTVARDDYASDADFRAEVQQSLLDLDAIGARLGGTLAQLPVRVHAGDSEFVTVGWRFRWESYAPSLPGEQSEEPDLAGLAVPVPRPPAEMAPDELQEHVDRAAAAREAELTEA